MTPEEISRARALCEECSPCHWWTLAEIEAANRKLAAAARDRQAGWPAALDEVERLRKIIKQIAAAYEVWSINVKITPLERRGSWPRDAFESWLEAAVEDAGITWDEVRAAIEAKEPDLPQPVRINCGSTALDELERLKARVAEIERYEQAIRLEREAIEAGEGRPTTLEERLRDKSFRLEAARESIRRQKREVERLRAALARITNAYDLYRARGVLPAPERYQELVSAITQAKID